MSHYTVVPLPDRRLPPRRIPSDDDWITISQFSYEDSWTFLDETPASPASSSTLLSATDPPTQPPSSVSDDGYDSGSECSTESIDYEPYTTTEKYSRVYPEIDGYPWPIDGNEVDRLERHSEALHRCLGQLIHGPLDKPGVILDIGMGTGYWAIKAADAYPGAMVVGVDRVLIQPELVPNNCKFGLYVEDRKEWHPVRHYKNADLIRVDRMYGDKPLLSSILEDADKYCAPGVVVEIHDLTVRLKDPKGATAFHQFYRDLKEAYRRDGRTWNLADSYKEMMRRVGFQRVMCVTREIPLNDRRTREEEEVYNEWKSGLAAHAIKLFCEGLGKDHIQAILEFAKVRNSLAEGIEGKLCIEVVYGVKPAAKLPMSLTYDQSTPLHRAAACGDALAVRELLKKGPDPNGRDYDDQTPLHLAARNKHQEVVKELLSQQHINLNPLEPSGHTPLMCAVESGATGVVGLLLETEGVDVDPISPTQRPLLQLAIEAGHIGTIERLLRDRRFDISCRWDYNSPLLASIRAGRDPVTLFVLSQGGLNDVRTPRGESALLLATRKRSLAVVKEILKDDKVDVDSTDHNGYNAFQWAVREGDLDMVQVLLANPRTNVRSVDSYGRSAFDIAEEYGNCRMVVLLNQHLDRTELGFRRTTQAHSSRGKCSYMMYCRR